MRSYIVFICIFYTLCLSVFTDDVDIGEIEVVEEIDDEQEKSEQPEKFTTVIIVDEEDETKNVAEVLAESSEVFIKDTGGEAGISTVSIRGSSSKNVLILLDGTPLNTGGNSSVDISMIPASSVEKIEIIRGGDAALYGSGAMGGVINIITKQPDKRFYKYSLGGTLFRGFNSIFSVGEKNKYYNIFFSGLYKYDLGNYLFLDNNGTEFNEDDDTVQEREHNDVRKISFLLNNTLFFPKDMFLGLNLHYNNKNNSIAGPLTFENHFTEAQLDSNLITTGIHYSLGNLSQYFTIDFYLDYKNDNYTYTNPREYGGGSVYSDKSLHYIQYETHGQIFAIPSNILHLAGEFSYETMEDIDPRVEVSGIIRDELYCCDENIGVLPTLRLQYNSDLKENFHFLWSLGAFFLPKSYFKIKVNGFHAFRNPDFYEMYYTYGQYVGNPDLKPETSYGGDIGFHLDIENFFLESVLFCTYYENLIQYLLSYGFVYKPMNIDTALSYGGEFRFQMTIIKALSLQVSYTLNLLNTIDDLENGIIRQLPGHPIHSLFGKVEYNKDFMTLGSQAKFEDTSGITYNSLKFIPPKVLIDIYLKMNFEIKKYNIKPSFFVNTNNILNVYTTDVRNYPLEGFHIDIGCSFEF
jgi:vitamin B12 transporter